jgi:hypothetical protein
VTIKHKLHMALAVVVPAGAVVGAAFATSAVVGLQNARDHYRDDALQPHPVVTVTDRPTTGSSPKPPESQPVETGSAPSRAEDSAPRSSGETKHEKPMPATSPENPNSASTCEEGHLISVRLPLGLLPCNALTVGGTR